MATYYEILGVPQNATTKDIRQAYRSLARKYHPDLNPNDKTAFLDNHKKRVDQWKAGPVDLRWDDTRKVWVAGGGGGAGADVWYSVMVDPAAINSSIQGASGATYNSLTCGSASSYCGGGCDHDAVAYFQAAEEPFYNDSNSPCPILKNHAV